MGISPLISNRIDCLEIKVQFLRSFSSRRLTGSRSPGPVFNLPSLNSRSALLLSSVSPYTTDPSMYDDRILICCLGVLLARPVHLVIEGNSTVRSVFFFYKVYKVFN